MLVVLSEGDGEGDVGKGLGGGKLRGKGHRRRDLARGTRRLVGDYRVENK